ncbi:MAG: tetraacyldisaccharide 4'-kinase [Holophagae bacterium]|jgi:tetraacyldisaccharide 4'-kinase
MTGQRAWRWLLTPLEPLYRGVVAARGHAYRRGWLRAARLSVPVVSVGNLTFGGTGKTPTVIALVRDLVRRGRHPSILTRGYGRTASHPVVVVGPEPGVTAALAGDEPLEMASRLPGVPVVVDADRARGGVEAVRRGADVLVLDDGFQHLGLDRDLDLVLIDAGDPWGGGRLPPRGRLREPVSGLARADAVLVTKLPVDAGPVLAAVRAVVDEVAPGTPVLAARLAPTAVRRPEGRTGPEVLDGAKVVALAGIGRPEGFAELLRAAGAVLCATRWFDDHHRYKPDEVDEVLGAAAAVDAVVVTTAKDAVKLPGDAPVWVVEAAMVPLTGSWDALWRLLPGGLA